MDRNIIFIHGAWMTPRCWEPFESFFTARGYTCQAPAWPYHDRPIDELRAKPDPGLKRLGLGEIIDHYAHIIQRLPAPPILIGHSFGGLVTQVLLDRGLGAVGVALDPAPTRGIIAAAYPTTTRVAAAHHRDAGRLVEGFPLVAARILVCVREHAAARRAETRL